MKIPVHCLDFLRDSKNKVELFLFLTEIASRTSFEEGKEVHIAQDQSVVSLGDGMQDCTHEEADTRVVVHVTDAAQRGYSRKICVRVVNTDILVILISPVCLQI